MCLSAVLLGKIPCLVSHLGSAAHYSFLHSAGHSSPAAIIWACSVTRWSDSLNRLILSDMHSLTLSCPPGGEPPFDTVFKNLTSKYGMPFSAEFETGCSYCCCFGVFSYHQLSYYQTSQFKWSSSHSNHMCHLTLWIHMQGGNLILLTSSLWVHWIITDLPGNDPGSFSRAAVSISGHTSLKSLSFRASAHTAGRTGWWPCFQHGWPNLTLFLKLLPEAPVMFPLGRHHYHGNIIHLGFGCVWLFMHESSALTTLLHLSVLIFR